VVGVRLERVGVDAAVVVAAGEYAVGIRIAGGVADDAATVAVVEDPVVVVVRVAGVPCLSRSTFVW